MNNGYTVAVTLGRNVGNVPMALYRWSDFQQKIRAVLSGNGTVIQEPARMSGAQMGEWDGVREDACTFIALLPTVERVGNVRTGLKFLCGLYKQQAIGYLVCDGTDNLVTP